MCKLIEIISKNTISCVYSVGIRKISGRLSIEKQRTPESAEKIRSISVINRDKI